jgi:glucose/arabinose dehydrogenase
MRTWLTKQAYASLAIATAALAGGCLSVVSSQGGGEADMPRRRATRTTDIAVQPGYRIEAVAGGLHYPTGVAFDDHGAAYVVESGYATPRHRAVPRVLRIEPGAEPDVIVQGRNAPWTGLAIANGRLVVSEGGADDGGRIVSYSLDGKDERVLVDGIPSLGDHNTNGPAIKDGYVYFGVGTATNAGIVGLDDVEGFAWVKKHPKFHDVPCKDVKLTGLNRKTENPLSRDGEDVETGAYSAFGTPTEPGQIVKGRIPCSGAILRVPTDGGAPELVAWGFRNPYGLAFDPAGRLWATDNGYDERGSRPVFGSADWLWKVDQGTWYGWPDYADGRPLTMDRYEPLSGPDPERVLAEIPNKPPKPAAFFGVHSSSDGIAFSTNPAFGFVGQAFVAQFGDMAPVVGKVMNPVGFKIVRVDPATGMMSTFAGNRGWPNGPASKLKTAGLERPIDCKFDPTGQALYVVDFGVLLIHDEDEIPKPSSGVLWRIVRGT